VAGTPDWIEVAPCNGKAQFMWYPPMDAKDPNVWYEMGRVVCSTCPVWQSCIEYGRDEKWGMWGGLSPKERRRKVVTHGKWTDFRRGCRCGPCWVAHETQMAEEPIDLGLLPNSDQSDYDDPSRFLFDIL
tara:strand:+ start:253 stop:642 length:390 start_codon:yes stop_codon:yes gene_type:complete